MAYIDSRTDSLRSIHSVYSHDIPSYLCNLADLKEFDRIKNISKNEGIELTKFNLFQYRYTRFDHAFGMSIILDKFLGNISTSLKALLKELSKPCFSYSKEYLIDYFGIKDFKEPELNTNFTASKVVTDLILNKGVLLEDIFKSNDDFLIFAKFPYLSCENLEYVLSNGYLLNICDLKEISELYNWITIDKNEDGEDEFCFTNIQMAYKFFRLSLEVGKKLRSYEFKITKSLIADVLMLMVRREDIALNDLYNLSENEIVARGNQCSDKRIREGWEEIVNLNKVYTRFNPTNDKQKYCVKLDEKPFYIDPLVKTKAGVFRLSGLDKNAESDCEAYFATDTDMYMYIDYEL